MNIEARRIPRGVGAILLALTLIFVAAVPTAMADTIYPDNVITGSAFDTGLQNGPGASSYAEVSNDCTVLLGLLPSTNPQVCQTHTTHAAGIGTPAGSLQQSYNGTANGLAPLLFTATARASSSPFTIGPNAPGAPGTTTFQFDRRADVNSIINLDQRATYTFTLVDVTAGNTRQELFREVLTDNDNVFQGWLNEGLPNAIPGHTYRIELDTVFDCAILCAGLQETVANFDNIRLRVEDGSPNFKQPTVVTLPADPISGTTATLNGTVNARGLPTTFLYRYSATTPNLNLSVGPFNGGTLTTSVSRPRQVTGLTPCTTYFFRIEATNSEGTSLGSTRSFRTNCKPTVQTLPANADARDATLNSAINPEGEVTQYHYEYGTVASGGFGTRAPAADLTLAAGRSSVQTNSVPVTGLEPETDYQVRVVASNPLGTSVGAPVTFRTTGLGLTGATGATGATGTTGATGATGAPGANGAPGGQGPAGPPGARGPAGQTPNLGSSIQDLLSTNKLAMIRIDATRLKVPMSGRDIGRVRVQIFCRPIAVRTCSGNMKVRSINKINPASTGKRPVRRVTFATDAVQLDVRKIGFGILNFNAQRRAVIRREGSIRASVIVSVIDANNNRQNVRRNVTIVPGKH
jgi:hypothetical protein